jgi:hypothetical protein
MTSTYAGSYQGQFVLPDGEGISGSYLVVLAGSSTHASLFADRLYATPITNPLPSVSAASGLPGVDNVGNVAFYADSSLDYDVIVTMTWSGQTTVLAPFRMHLIPDSHFDAAAAIATRGPVFGSNAWLTLYAATPDVMIAGAITRDPTTGAATSAAVVWPDGSTGTYTATVLSSTFPGAVDAYTVTYVGAVTKTVTQTTVTRDSTTGAVTNRPAMTVA